MTTDLVKSECSFYDTIMARVSAVHLQARRQQILDAARRCFLRDGFHATSVQDILHEAGMSAGGVYRYFKSKEDIIEAVGAENVALVTSAFESALSKSDPLPFRDLLPHLLTLLQEADRNHGALSIAVQIWSESMRNAALAGRVAELYASLRDTLKDLVTYYQSRGEISPEVAPDDVSSTLLALIVGCMLEHGVFGGLNTTSVGSGLWALVR